MTSPWTALLPVALIGTDRQPAGLAPAWPGEVGTLIAQAAAASPSPPIAVLQAAAVLATCSLAGAQAAIWSEPLPAAAADDPLAPVDDAALVSHIAWAFREGPQRLHHEVCAVLASAGLRLPLDLLPLALDAGRRSIALRPLLMPVIGHRGTWLAALRDDWRYAAGSTSDEVDDAYWHEGTFEQRRAFLQHERANDPRAARERLTQSLGDLAAKERADLAAVLAEGIGAEDEPLIEALRADRSREVRLAALALLLLLPAAAHPQRAVARLEPLLRHESGLLRKRWTIDAPSEAAASWKADNVDAARPQNESLGERAWWLYQIVRQVPLAWWSQRTGMPASGLLEWAASTDWHESLIRGWRDVLLAAPDPAWCEALLDRWPQGLLRDDPVAFLALLPRAERERRWGQQLAADMTPLDALLAHVLAGCPLGETLTAALSRTLADRFVGDFVRLGAYPALRAQLPDLCCCVHPDALGKLAGLPRPPDATPGLIESFQTLDHIVAARRALQSLNRTSTS